MFFWYEKVKKFIDESKNETKNYAHCLWGCPTAQLFPCDDNFPKFSLIYLNPIASCNGIWKSGISNPINDWNPESSTWNPESTAWNPESKFTLDPLLGARNRKIIGKSCSSSSSWLIRISRLAIESRQPTNAICIYNIQEKVSLTELITF